MRIGLLSLLLGFIGVELGLRLNLHIATYVFALIGVLIPPMFILLKNLFKEVRT